MVILMFVTPVLVFFVLLMLFRRHLRIIGGAETPHTPAVRSADEPVLPQPQCDWTALDDHQLDRLLRDSAP
jgi:hypothetical protein